MPMRDAEIAVTSTATASTIELTCADRQINFKILNQELELEAC